MESTPVGVESNPKYFNNMIVVVVEKLRGADCDCRLFSWPGSSFSPDLKLLRFSSPDRSHYSSSYQECVCGMTKGTVHPEDSAASEMEEGYRCITCQVLLLFAIIIEPGRCLGFGHIRWLFVIHVSVVLVLVTAALVIPIRVSGSADLFSHMTCVVVNKQLYKP